MFSTFFRRLPISANYADIVAVAMCIRLFLADIYLNKLRDLKYFERSPK